MYFIITNHAGRTYRKTLAQGRHFTPNGTLMVKVFHPRKVILTNAL